MNIIIESYIFLCVMLLIFDIGFLVVKNTRNHKYYPQDDKFKIIIQNEFEGYSKGNGLSNAFKEQLPKKIKKTRNLVILQNQLEDVKNFREEISLELRPFIFDELENYKEKSDYEQAYYTYVISKLDYSKYKADYTFCSKFITFLDSKSLYTFTNTMNAIYRFGDHNLMSLGIEKVNDRNGFYHKKLFVDGLLTFSGNYDQLNELIKYKFYKYSPSVQESLLDYFRLKNVNASEICIDILKNKKADSQVLYSAMRYFAKYPDIKSKEVFIDILQRNNDVWIEHMLAIQGLKHYSDSRVKSLVGAKIISSNWYVRTNAVSYLHDQNISKEDICNILFIKDKYANEALLYQYKDDLEMSAYIMNTVEILNGEEIESKEIEGDFVAVCK
ncbi:MAG: hypothetical protein RSA29_07510 [Clostridium sp.]|uniref:hypothetical protein n=1 Tax=Clostridium sp. TaxID=1506 RepID=UPI00306D7952